MGRHMLPVYEQPLAHPQLGEAHIPKRCLQRFVQFWDGKCNRLLPLAALPFFPKLNIDQYTVMKHIGSAAHESPSAAENNKIAFLLLLYNRQPLLDTRAWRGWSIV